jgi:hypothetical protein
MGGPRVQVAIGSIIFVLLGFSLSLSLSFLSRASAGGLRLSLLIRACMAHGSV